MKEFFKSSRTWFMVVLIAAGALFIYYVPLISPLSELMPSSTPTPDVTGWKSYTNQKFAVSLKYPPQFLLKPGPTGPLAEWELYGLTAGSEIASVNVMRSYEPKTNFGDASLRMGVSTESTAVQQCLAPPSGFGYVDAYVQRNIGGTIFHKFTRSDAGAGNYYDFTSYRAVRNGGCEVFEYVIHYSNIQNYPAESGIKEYDRPKIASVLESILDTVKFSK